MAIYNHSITITENIMKLLIQRVSQASVTVNNQIVGQINQGLLIFIGIVKGDTSSQADYLAHKVSNLRIFEDENGKMNRSVKDIGGKALVISQFTLAGNCSRGNRPGFDNAACPKDAETLYQYFSSQLRTEGVLVENGIFQADMQVNLTNDGPVTFLLEK